MKILIYFITIFFSSNLMSNEVEIIELHQNKSLDQLVLDELENEINNVDENIEEELNTNLDSNGEIVADDNENSVEELTIEVEKNLLNDLETQFVDKFLANSNNIKSEILRNEFYNFLLNLNLDYEKKDNRTKYYLIVKYFYEIGEISKAFSLINSRDVSNDENLFFYQIVQLNYFLSTFKLEQSCNFKNQITKNTNIKNNFLDKIEIFCLILENKTSEAELLNSIMLETEQNIDDNFQELFLYLIDPEYLKNTNQNWYSSDIKPDLIFLYSAMARIAELPLNEEFLMVDPLNMAIPIILNKSTPIDLRIKAANLSYLNKSLTVDSLSALYQSVDFNSEQLNSTEKTVKSLSDRTDLLMAYHYQLVNIQIFPSERLEALKDFWDFAQKNNLENIAYALSYKIIQSIEITSEYLNYSPEIAISYIFNKDYENSLKWINLYENANGIDDKIILVKILLDLHLSEDANSIVEIIRKNLNKLFDSVDNYNDELIYILFDILNEDKDNKLKENFDKIYDQRLMPSIFIIENINEAIDSNNEHKLLLYSIISLNDKEWEQIHPQHLKMILRGFLKYKDSALFTKIILEIFENYKII